MIKKRGVKLLAFLTALVMAATVQPNQFVMAETAEVGGPTQKEETEDKGETTEAADPTSDTSNKIHFIALKGHSDAMLIESNGRFGMVDSGEDTDYPDGSDERYPFRSGITITAGYEEDVIAYLKSVGVTKNNFEFYLGTHPHSDHIGSADEIIREFEPDRVYIMEYKDEYISSESNLWDNLYVYDKMIAAAKEVGAVLIQNFDEEAPVVPESDDSWLLSWPWLGKSKDYAMAQRETSGAETADGTAADSVTADSGTEAEADAEVSDEQDDSRTYAFLSQEEIKEKYGVDPLDPADPQAVDSELDDGRGFPILISDDPNSTMGDSDRSTTGNPNFTLGDMEIHVLNYSDDYKTTPKPDCNYFSLGVLVEVNGHRTFLGGDIGNYDGDEERLAEYLGEVDVLKLGHHGLASSNTVDYLNALQPDYVISTGTFNALQSSEGRLDALNQLAEAKGTRLYFTREYAMADQGTGIVISFDKDAIRTNVSPEAIFFCSGTLAPYVYCYRDGYQYPYTGFVISSEKRYYFGESVTPLTSQWFTDSGNWYYAKADGTMQTGWMDGYYFNSEGIWIKNTVAEGWVKNSRGWWYRNPDNTYPKEQWKLIKGTYYYFDANGYMVTGWLAQDGKWYYLKSDGVMATGWVSDGGKWYYMNGSGVMQTGWIKTGGKYYYLDTNGAMKTGWLQIDGSWYYLNSSGAMTTGWQSVNNEWYYMDVNGVMQTGWLTLLGKTYYLESSGSMVSGWRQIDRFWYYFGAAGDGVMRTGWQKVDGSWYYMDANGVRQTGWQTIKEKKYYLTGSGVMKTGWQKIGGIWYYFESDGAMTTGWQKIGGKWYYMNEDGVMQANCWIENCYVGSDGAWLQGKIR